jgi:hypothetical protein
MKNKHKEKEKEKGRERDRDDRVKISDLVALAKAAAITAADYQDRFAAEDTEARKIVDIMESFLRIKGRVVYGGAAINAHLPPSKKFYDPTLYLPDYDFLTPDPLQDCADLIVTFQKKGFSDVEAKFGIHEGTYKVFVNYRAAADITHMPDDIYSKIVADSKQIDGIQYASVNYLRMNMYLELSRPAGMVSRWEKVYERLLLLNETHPLKAGRCYENEIKEFKEIKESNNKHNQIIGAGIENGVVFISREHDDPILMMSDHSLEFIQSLVKKFGFKAVPKSATGEMVPAHVELYKQTQLVAVVFETVACHSYTTLSPPAPIGYKMGSIDLLIQMYYSFYFADIHGYIPGKILCTIQSLIELETSQRIEAVRNNTDQDVFPLECIGHQPTVPELKRAHRKRVEEKRKSLEKVLARD